MTHSLQNQEFEVLIVGGGVIGLAIARELKKRGISRFAVLEKNAACGLEATSAAAGMLAPQAEASQADVFFKLCQVSRDLYPQFAAELFAETGIDTELNQAGTLYLAFNNADLAELERRLKWQKAANLPIEKLNEREISELEPNISKLVVGALRFPLDWQVENTKINEALIKTVNEHCFTNAQVQRLTRKNDKVFAVQTATAEIYAHKIIIASGAWTSLINFPKDLASEVEVAPIRGQMLSFAGDRKLFRHVIYSPRGYVVPRFSHRILVGATVENAGFENRTTGAGVASLLQTAFEIAPIFQQLGVEKIWSGLRPKTPDGLPLLGEFPENSNLLWATGHYRNGILLAPITAQLIADKICGDSKSEKKPDFLQLFNPQRFQNSNLSF